MATMSDHDFEGYFFVRGNPKGVNLERWRHAHGCNRFFNAIRDTVTDRFLKVYPSGEPRPSDAEVKALLDAQPEGRKDGGAIVGTRTMSARPHPRESRPLNNPYRVAPRLAIAFQSRRVFLRRPLLRRARRRHAGLRPARQRRASGGPLVQVSPPARHPVGRRGRAQRPRRHRARQCPHRAQRPRHGSGIV